VVFSSSIFLYYFLPAFGLAYFLLPWRNAVLLAFSLLFYAWGDPVYILLLLLVCGANYILGRYIAPDRPERVRATALGLAVCANMGVLLYFKYAGFFVENLNTVLARWGVEPITLVAPALPLGISFFLFQAVSYVMDVYRGHCEPSKSFWRVTLYISLFPQLVAGPIVRYQEVAADLVERTTDWGRAVRGAQRFIIGLSKKVLVADALSGLVDQIFSMPVDQLAPGVVWFGAVCFAVQILFDFSGYTDMAIGIATVLGFRFSENFNRPYMATSIQDFWRRWHMTLSSWFRDYLYIPLGGNRRGAVRTYLNLLIVFLLTGFWHGASWNFVAWGLFHGAFLIVERLGWSRALDNLPRIVGRVYVWGVILVSWVLFRSDSGSHTLEMLGVMFSPHGWAQTYDGILRVCDPDEMLALLVGLSIALGVWGAVFARVTKLFGQVRRQPGAVRLSIEALRVAVFLGAAVLCMAGVASQTHQAFIYFRF